MEYFQLAKSLNERFREELLKKEAHFRGSVNSLSLISLNKETPEMGVGNIKTEARAVEELQKFNPEKPKRNTPEKSLQSWIILNAMRNNNVLPFGDNLTFITSELAIVLEDGRKVVNDILAVDKDNSLVVVELKSERVNSVKEQALDFKGIIEARQEFFKQLTELMTGKNWNGNVKCAIVWKKSHGTPQPAKDEHKKIDVFEYSEHPNHYTFD